MLLKLLASAAVISLAVASPAMAQHSIGATDPNPNSDMNAPRPDANSGPDREAYEDRMEKQLREWQGRVDQFADEANASGDVNRKTQAHHLQESWTGAQQQWKNMKQVQGDSWVQARADFTKNMERLNQQWNDAQTHTKPPTRPNAPQK